MQAYTDEDSFLEDDYAKGKELHAVVWKSCNEYEPLGTDFVEKLSTVHLHSVRMTWSSSKQKDMK